MMIPRSSVKCNCTKGDKKSPIFVHREKVKEIVKKVASKRVELEKQNLEKLASFQANIKIIISEDVQIIKDIIASPPSRQE